MKKSTLNHSVIIRLLLNIHKSLKGFTLVEVLIVVALLGLISSTVIFNTTAFTKTGIKTSCIEEAQTTQVAVNSCMAESSMITINQPATVGPGEAAPDMWLLADGSNSGYVGAFLRREITGTYNVDINGLVTALAYPGLNAEDINSVNNKLSGS
jgi:prepilin-type N-terminal cleavage/methylation domain-containing protein